LRLIFNEFQDYPCVDFEFRFHGGPEQMPDDFTCPVSALIGS